MHLGMPTRRRPAAGLSRSQLFDHLFAEPEQVFNHRLASGSRGFTELSEHLSPQKLLLPSILNSLMSHKLQQAWQTNSRVWTSQLVRS